MMFHLVYSGFALFFEVIDHHLIVFTFTFQYFRLGNDYTIRWIIFDLIHEPVRNIIRNDLGRRLIKETIICITTRLYIRSAIVSDDQNVIINFRICRKEFIDTVARRRSRSTRQDRTDRLYP